MKKNVFKVFFNVLSVLVACALLLVVMLRKTLFSGNSILANLYEEELSGEILVKVIKSAIIVVVIYGVCCLSNLALMIGNKVKNNKVKTWILLIGNVIKYLGVVVAFLEILSVCGVDTTALVTGAGVLTLIVGLGCQSVVSDIVAGIFIMFEGKFVIGDVVVIGGWRGTVQNIGLRTTSIIDAAGNVKIINNSSISDIVNNTRALSVAICDVGIEYDESIERVEKILSENFAEIKASIPAIIEGPFYKGVSALADSSVNIKIIAKTKEEDKFQVERDLNRAIKILFDKNGVNIPFPQVVLNYREANLSKDDIDLITKRIAKEFNANQKKLSKGIEEGN